MDLFYWLFLIAIRCSVFYGLQFDALFSRMQFDSFSYSTCVITLVLWRDVGGSPPKPWEQEGNNNNASGPKPFRPPSNTSTADSVEASGTANPGELVSSANRTNTAATMNGLTRPVPSRPWEQQQTYGSTYGGGYGSNLGMNSGYGSGTYGSGLGGYGSSYGGGMYGGSSMYNRGGYGGGGMYGSSGMYGGGGMYNSSFGGGYGMGMGTGMGMGMGMSPYGGQDPNDPFNQPPSPPGFWISFLRVVWFIYSCLCCLKNQRTQLSKFKEFVYNSVLKIGSKQNDFFFIKSA